MTSTSASHGKALVDQLCNTTATDAVPLVEQADEAIRLPQLSTRCARWATGGA